MFNNKRFTYSLTVWRLQLNKRRRAARRRRHRWNKNTFLQQRFSRETPSELRWRQRWPDWSWVLLSSLVHRLGEKQFFFPPFVISAARTRDKCLELSVHPDRKMRYIWVCFLITDSSDRMKLNQTCFCHFSHQITASLFFISSELVSHWKGSFSLVFTCTCLHHHRVCVLSLRRTTEIRQKIVFWLLAFSSGQQDAWSKQESEGNLTSRLQAELCVYQREEWEASSVDLVHLWPTPHVGSHE